MILTEQRAPSFQRNPSLERLLVELRTDLLPAEHVLIERFRGSLPKHPVVLIMGPLRSGTTLFMQWLANLGVFAYPTNLLSRFYAAPIIGAKIQLLLTDPRYQFRAELADVAGEVEYISENGKTLGTLAPNEFWYFWRRFLSEPGRDVWSDAELERTFDSATLMAELAGLTEVFAKPFAAKAMLFNYNVRFLDALLPRVLFIRMRRNQEANVLSVLDARRRQFGDISPWYSFRIPEYSRLAKLPPIEQTAGQVHFINRALDRGFRGLDSSRNMVVDYEDFCRTPARTYADLCARLQIDTPYTGPASFPIRESTDRATFRQIERALADFAEIADHSGPAV